MKKKIATAFLTLATTIGFTQNTSLEQAIPNLVQLGEVKPTFPSIQEKNSAKKSFGYLRMGVSDAQVPANSIQQVLPGLGLGYRLASGASAIDISASFNRRDVRTDEGKERTYLYTFPKANYLHYISPEKNNSVYAGGGLAWGGLRTKDEREFHGLIPNLAVGYEMNRKAAWRSFVQLDVSQPAIAASQKGNFPRPFAELSVGAGF